MAKLEDSKPKDSSGAYARALGNRDLGALITRVHSTSISNGSELEKLIANEVKGIENLDEFLEQPKMPEGVFLASKRQVKRSQTLDSNNSEPDFLIFKRRDGVQTCHLIELKDGHSFDTKKASGEKAAMQTFMEKNGARMSYTMDIHFVAFNMCNRDKIVTGFKNRITSDEAMTGREFCVFIEIDYDEIVERRMQDQQSNFDYFIRELIKIDQIRSAVEEMLNKERL